MFRQNTQHSFCRSRDSGWTKIIIILNKHTNNTRVGVQKSRLLRPPHTMIITKQYKDRRDRSYYSQQSLFLFPKRRMVKWCVKREVNTKLLSLLKADWFRFLWLLFKDGVKEWIQSNIPLISYFVAVMGLMDGLELQTKSITTDFQEIGTLLVVL